MCWDAGTGLRFNCWQNETNLLLAEVYVFIVERARPPTKYLKSWLSNAVMSS